MTHDELLAKIAKLSITPETNIVPSELATALMAVVELHKPFKSIDPDKGWFCMVDGVVKYPCPTIQTIEKEIK